jgi:transposase
METDSEPLPDDIDALKAEVAAGRARAAADQALIAHQQLQIAKLRHQLYGQRSERAARLIEQMELGLEELEAAASEDEIAAEQAAARTTNVAPFTRKRPSRQPFPEHLPRERLVEPAPATCLCCGGARLRKLGEDVTETLEVIPRNWKVIQHVREKFTCRDCEAISQPPAPFHVTPRGWAGPSLLAMIMFEKFGQHQPLNRQAERYAREGVPLSLSTLADQVGACTAALMPLFNRLRRHVMAAERLHGDDTTVPVLARGKTDIARAWVYVRDDRPDSRKEQLAQAKRMLTEAGGRIDRLLQMVEQGLMSVDDPALKERLDTAKVARVAASERVRMLDRPNEAGTSQITPDKINKLSVVLREALKSSDIGFRKAYLRLSLDRVVVADDEIRLRGPTIALAKAAAAGGLPATAGLVPSFVQEWRPVRDSNPCYQRERLVSWASRRTGRWAAWVAFPQAGVKARFAQGSVA